MIVPPRNAASLIVFRPAERVGETAILMGLRGANHRFMPNRLVFPGGAVDAADFSAPHASPLNDAALAGLRRGADAPLAQALASAAARELAEETGLSLGDPPALHGLAYLCRAITPPSYPQRFDARFLAVARSEVTGNLAGSGELEDLRDYTLDAALALDLAWITARVLEQFRAWLLLTPEARQSRERFPVCREQVWGEE
jgi:8-oxo-dGTP pyrophosphatase MutT (NUDIX family)